MVDTKFQPWARLSLLFLFPPHKCILWSHRAVHHRNAGFPLCLCHLLHSSPQANGGPAGLWEGAEGSSAQPPCPVAHPSSPSEVLFPIPVPVPASLLWATFFALIRSPCWVLESSLSEPHFLCFFPLLSVRSIPQGSHPAPTGRPGYHRLVWVLPGLLSLLCSIVLQLPLEVLTMKEQSCPQLLNWALSWIGRHLGLKYLFTGNTRAIKKKKMYGGAPRHHSPYCG